MCSDFLIDSAFITSLFFITCYFHTNICNHIQPFKRRVIWRWNKDSNFHSRWKSILIRSGIHHSLLEIWQMLERKCSLIYLRIKLANIKWLIVGKFWEQWAKLPLVSQTRMELTIEWTFSPNVCLLCSLSWSKFEVLC